MALMFLFWQFVIMVGHDMPHVTPSGFFWYLHFVPALFTPAVLLMCALRVGTPGRLLPLGFAEPILYLITGLCCLLVLTNHAHQMVFSVEPADGMYQGGLGLELGYWVILGWAFIMYAAYVAVLASSSHRKMRYSIGLVCIVFAVGLTYVVCAALRVGGLYSVPLTLAYELMVVIGVEICLALGFLPSFTRYAEMFRSLPVDLGVFSRSGVLGQSTDSFEPMDPEVVPLAMGNLRGLDSTEFRINQKPGVLYRVYRVLGGFVLASERTSGIEAQRDELERQYQVLGRNIEALERTNSIAERLARQKKEYELLDDVGRSLDATVLRICALLEDLPDDDTQEGLIERQRRLFISKMLVAYCKRKGGLIISGQSGDDYDRERMRLIIGEVASDLRTTGVECESMVVTSRSLPAQSFSTLYDCLYDAALLSLELDDPVLMTYLGDADESLVEMRVVLESPNLRDTHDNPVLDAFREKLASHGATCSHDGEEGRIAIAVRVPHVPATAEGGGEAW